jgi:hypothetical protein
VRSSIGLWVRADWRRRRASLLALTLLAGLSFAVVAVAVAGARRTATSFERLRATTLAYDHGVAIDAPGENPGDGRGYDDATVRRIEQLPQVAAIGEIVTYVASVPGADWELALNAPVGGVVGTQIEHDRILRGRMPARQSDDEVAVNEATAKETRVDVGGTLTLDTMTPDQRIQLMGGDAHALDHGLAGPELRLRVVGVVRGVTDVVGNFDKAVIASPHFDISYRGRIAYSNRILLVRRASGFTPDDFHTAVDSAVGGAQLGVFDATHEDRPARRTIHTLALGLVVFALVAGAVSMLAVNQAVSRHVVGSNPAHPALVALGLTRAQRVRAAMVTVVPAAAAGALIATVASYVASPVMPVGLARTVEPDPGLQVDWLVAGLTALGVVVIVIGQAMIAGLSATRADASPRLHTSRRSAARVSHLTAAMTATGAGPVAATGLRLAFDRRPPALPVRSTVIGVGAALAVIVGALTFTSSLDRLENTPHRWGYGWDLLLDTTVDGQDQLVDALKADRDVDSVSVVETNFTYIDRDAPLGVRSYGLGSSSGTIGYSLLSGLQPVGPDEVVIGPAMAKRLHLAVGDVTQVATCPCSGDPATTTMTQVRVVGISLFPEDDDGNFNDSLGFSVVGFQRHVGETATTQVAVKVAPGHNVSTVASDLGKRFPGQLSQYGYPSRPGEVASLAGLRSFPRALSVLAALLALAALANMLVATRQRRRRELATLRSLGFTPRETRGSVIWQSVFVTAVAGAIGVALGVFGGAVVWLATTHGIGVATDALRPVAAITSSTLLTLVVAIALGFLIGSRVALTSVAQSLNDE